MWFGEAEAADLTIPQAHPRLWWTPERLATAREWHQTHQISITDNVHVRAWGNALLYVLTDDASYARKAIYEIMNFTISSGELSSVASDTYRVYDWPPVVFDWCYDEMTQTERDTFMARYNGYADIMMGKGWGGPRFPSSNYFWGYFRNELNWGIATYNDT